MARDIDNIMLLKLVPKGFYNKNNFILIRVYAYNALFFPVPT